MLICFLSFTAFAANFRATVSKNPVTVGERVQVTFTLDANGANFTGPKFTGFKVLGGPSQSNQTSIVNGSMTRSLSLKYILVAIKEGHYTISPATIKVKGETIKSNSIKITVAPESDVQKQRRQQKEKQESDMSKQATDLIKKNLFVKLSVNKSNVYKGEPFTAVYKIFRHPDLNLANLSAANAPVFDGFFTQEFDIDNYDWQWEEVNNVRFLSAIVKKVVLIPQKTGKLKLEAFEFNCTARLPVQNQNNRRSAWDNPFFNRSSYRDFEYLASSGERTITVKDLPVDAPASFTGTVGSVEMETWFDVTETKAGEPVTLKVRITGNGNLRMIDAPVVTFPPDFEVYDPKLSDNTSVTSSTISGNILYEYLAIPRNPGKYDVGPIEFSYFDLKEKKYVTLKSEKYTISVAKGDGKNVQNLGTGLNKEDIEILNSDIKYIHTKTNINKNKLAFFGSSRFYVFLVLPILLLLIIILLRNKIKANAADIVGMKNKKAAKMAKKRLAIANNLLKSGDKDIFFEELVRALWGYVSDKLSIPTSELTKDNVAVELAKKQIDADITENLLKTIEQCEFARYAPSGDTEAMMNDTYKNAELLIITIENKI